jgi:hypothetical protein
MRADAAGIASRWRTHVLSAAHRTHAGAPVAVADELLPWFTSRFISRFMSPRSTGPRVARKAQPSLRRLRAHCGQVGDF